MNESCLFFKVIQVYLSRHPTTWLFHHRCLWPPSCVQTIAEKLWQNDDQIGCGRMIHHGCPRPGKKWCRSLFVMGFFFELFQNYLIVSNQKELFYLNQTDPLQFWSLSGPIPSEKRELTRTWLSALHETRMLPLSCMPDVREVCPVK